MLESIDFAAVTNHADERPLYQDLADDIIRFLTNAGRSTFNQIVARVRGRERNMLRLLDQMVTLRILRFEDDHFCLPDCPPSTPTPIDIRCPFSDEKRLGHIADLMEPIYAARPKPTIVFNQRHVSHRTNVRRAAYMIWRGDVQGKDIAFIGDDDLTSIFLALTRLAKRITVFDVDERLTAYISAVSTRLQLGIEVIAHDVTNPIPQQYQNCYDVFLTDPSPSCVPFCLFSNAGIRLLRQQVRLPGYLSIYPSSKELHIVFQKLLTSMGLIITDVVPFFVQYECVIDTYSEADLALLRRYCAEGAQLSFHEHFMRVERTADTQPMDLEYEKQDLIERGMNGILDQLDRDPAYRCADVNERAYLAGAAGRLRGVPLSRGRER
jgi:hypothetical protein